MKIFFIILGSFSVILTLVPFIKSDVWWIRVLDYPRFQVMALALISLVGILINNPIDHYSDFMIISLLVTCLLYQFFIILPYTPVYKPQVKNSKAEQVDSSVSILISNVLMDNNNYEKLLDIIKKCDPDIIIAIETNKWWQDKLDVIKVNYTESISYPLDNTYGMLLYSKLALSESKIRFLVEDDIPSIFTKVQLNNGKEIALYALHPTPPVPGENNRSTERDAELLIVGKEVKNSTLPSIVAGDLNDVAWSYTTKLFQKMSGLLDPRIGRGLFNTFNSKYPLLRWPLDHVFHSNHFKVVKLERLPHFGSDHFPIFINLHLDPQAVNEQNEPSANKDEKKEAQEKIEKV